MPPAAAGDARTRMAPAARTGAAPRTPRAMAHCPRGTPRRKGGARPVQGGAITAPPWSLERGGVAARPVGAVAPADIALTGLDVVLLGDLVVPLDGQLLAVVGGAGAGPAQVLD